MESTETRAKRLMYQSFYRGCKETDIILGEFAKKNLLSFNDEELSLFEALLDEDDKQIFNWFTGIEEMPQKHKNPVTEKISAFLANNRV